MDDENGHWEGDFWIDDNAPKSALGHLIWIGIGFVLGLIFQRLCG
jgi:hypothetical protein